MPWWAWAVISAVWMLLMLASLALAWVAGAREAEEPQRPDSDRPHDSA